MNTFKPYIIRFINLLPYQIKWKLYSYSFFKYKLRVDFPATRRKILNRSSKMIVVGANDGISFDDLILDLHPHKTEGVFIEPSKRYFNQLKENLKRFHNLKLLNFAISKDQTLVSLFQLNDLGLKKMPDWGRGLGSFSKDHLLKFDLVTELDLEEEIVVCKHFSWVVEEYHLHSVDYLQIDTEGYDAEIIKMIDFDNFSSKIVKFEIANLLKSDLNEVMAILESKGFFLLRSNSDMIAYSKKVNLVFY